MRVLVTGATGFLGANLVEALTTCNYNVVTLHRPKSSFEALEGLDYEKIEGDILDIDSLLAAMKDIDWVFHVAGEVAFWRASNKVLYEVNVNGTRNVMAAAFQSNVSRVIFTSSVAALGLTKEGRPLNETSKFNLPPEQFPYGYTKHLAEKVVIEYVNLGLPATIVSPSIVIGPRDRNMVFGTILNALKYKKLPFIPSGAGNYIDVRDAATGHILAAIKGEIGARYILGSHNMSHQIAIETISQIMNISPPPIKLSPQLTEPFAILTSILSSLGIVPKWVNANQVRLSSYTLYYDTSKSKTELGMNEPIPFQKSICDALQWYAVRDKL